MSTQQVLLPTALIELAEQLNMPAISTWNEAKVAFSRWGRQPGQERWELPFITLNKTQLKKVDRSLTALGFIKAISPKENQYDYAVVLGGTVPSMISRFNYLIEQWKAGIRFKHLVFLTGQRPLSKTADRFETNLLAWSSIAKQAQWTDKTLPMDEPEAAQLIYVFAELPPALRKVPVFYSHTPRTWQITAHQWQRANTAMTIHSWLKGQRPTPGKTLVVSSQPNAPYQHQVIMHNMPASFLTETIAPACQSHTPLAIKLDAVWLWVKNH